MISATIRVGIGACLLATTLCACVAKTQALHIRETPNAQSREAQDERAITPNAYGQPPTSARREPSGDAGAPQKVFLAFSSEGGAEHAEALLFLPLMVWQAAHVDGTYGLCADRFDPATGQTAPCKDPHKTELTGPEGFSAPAREGRIARPSLRFLEVYTKTGESKNLYCRIGEGELVLPLLVQQHSASGHHRVISVSPRWPKYCERIPPGADFPAGAIRITAPSTRDGHQDRLEFSILYSADLQSVTSLGTDFSAGVP